MKQTVNSVQWSLFRESGIYKETDSKLRTVVSLLRESGIYKETDSKLRTVVSV